MSHEELAVTTKAFDIARPMTERARKFPRELRAGSWNNDNPDNFRCAYRNNNRPDNRINNKGFRYASTLQAEARSSTRAGASRRESRPRRGFAFTGGAACRTGAGRLVARQASAARSSPGLASSARSQRMDLLIEDPKDGTLLVRYCVRVGLALGLN